MGADVKVGIGRGSWGYVEDGREGGGERREEKVWEVKRLSEEMRPGTSTRILC